MTTSNGERARRLRALEVLAAVEAYQRMLIRRGSTPDTERMFAFRLRAELHLLTATLLGVVTAAFSIVAIFLVLNRLFHIEL